MHRACAHSLMPGPAGPCQGQPVLSLPCSGQSSSSQPTARLRGPGRLGASHPPLLGQGTALLLLPAQPRKTVYINSHFQAIIARKSARKLIFFEMKAYFTCFAPPKRCSLDHVLRGPKSSSVQAREKLGASIFSKYMLSVCDYQWKCAITCINLILEAKCPTGWQIAGCFLLACDSLQTPSLPPSLRVRSHQERSSRHLTGASPPDPD